MGITMVIKIPVGDALRVFWSAPSWSQMTRILRRSDDAFSGADDAGAVLAYEGDGCVAADLTVTNGQQVWYKPYFFDGATWVDGGDAVSAVAESSYQDYSTDVLSITRERLALGLVAEVASGAIQHSDGVVPVLTAPPTFEDARWPLVTVKMAAEDPAERFIGDMLAPDAQGVDGTWREADGWLAQTSISIVGWCLNPDERIQLRKAIRRLIVANLPVFSEWGIVNVSASFSDDEDLQTYNAPVYQVICTLTCKAPVLVGSEADPVEDVVVSPQY